MKKYFAATAAIALTIAFSAGTADASRDTHTVIGNDTFWKLSLQYNIPLQQLLDANKYIDPLNLQIGMKLSLPGNSSSAAMAASVAGDSALSKSQQTQTVLAPGGEAYAYSKQFDVKATAYTSAASENGKWGPVDYFGNKLQVGTVAVDPKMIPLGTKLYLTGYDYNGLPKGGMVATATDIGGSIKGNRIDIFVPGTTQQARRFGIQDVKVYILE